MKKLLAVILSILLITCVFTGCSATKSDYSPTEGAPSFIADDMVEMAENSTSANTNEEYATDDTGTNRTSELKLPQGRKIILNASIEMESLDYDKTYTELIDEIGRMGGYISFSTENGNASLGSVRYLTITARIPTNNYSSFLSKAGDIGNILSKSESSDDVTAQYVDVNARLDTLRVKEERLLAILETATDLESIISIENSLSEVRYEIESYESTKRTLDDLIDYSTVDISLREVKTLTETDDSFLAKLGDAFKGSLRNFVYGLQSFVIGFIYSLPTLLVIAVIVVAIIVVIKKAKRKSSKKPQEPSETKPDNESK